MSDRMFSDCCYGTNDQHLPTEPCPNAYRFIDLTAERARREKPDAEFTRRDDFGRPMGLFALDYQFGGKDWTTELWAYSAEDAAARVEAMRHSLTVAGQLHEQVLA